MHGFAGGRWVRRLVLGLVAMTMVAGAPSRAWAGCVEEAIESCQEEFSSTSDKLVGILGWCYIIRTAWCELFDVKDS
jgi:hypothetical protein